MRQRLMWVLWPSFVVAGVAEIAFFTLVDPQELYLFGEPVYFSRMATYSIGFFGFWAVCAAASFFTCFLQRSAKEVNAHRHPAAH
ncbi:MAG: hypothetical protein JSR19_13185 [Proteobacteria bacterium]|nr:hypothetical protein [Pseudomonadota bacterium]HQR03461.1 hypothetical protein [Rhodocyclaceae bacterium]